MAAWVGSRGELEVVGRKEGAVREFDDGARIEQWVAEVLATIRTICVACMGVVRLTFQRPLVMRSG